MRHPYVDSKEIRIPRNDLIRGRRTGIIITLLPISSETVETTRRKEKVKWPGPSENEMKGSRDREEGTKGEESTHTERERERERARERDERFALGTRYIDRLYAMLGPMAWRSRQIIITNHQLFARNG